MTICYHNRLPLFFDENIRTIKKTCKLYEQTFDVPFEVARTQYIEHVGCGGLLARWLDRATMRLKGGCTKCDYSEDREA